MQRVLMATLALACGGLAAPSEALGAPVSGAAEGLFDGILDEASPKKKGKKKGKKKAKGKRGRKKLKGKKGASAAGGAKGKGKGKKGGVAGKPGPKKGTRLNQSRAGGGAGSAKPKPRVGAGGTSKPSGGPLVAQDKGQGKIRGSGGPRDDAQPRVAGHAPARGGKVGAPATDGATRAPGGGLKQNPGVRVDKPAAKKGKKKGAKKGSAGAKGTYSSGGHRRPARLRGPLSLGIKGGGMGAGFAASPTDALAGLGGVIRYRSDNGLLGFEGGVAAYQDIGGASLTSSLVPGFAGAHLMLLPQFPLTPYASAGLSLMGAELRSGAASENLAAGSEGTSEQAFYAGPYAAVGLDYAFARNLSLDLEGRYMPEMGGADGVLRHPRVVQGTLGLTLAF